MVCFSPANVTVADTTKQLSEITVPLQCKQIFYVSGAISWLSGASQFKH